MGVQSKALIDFWCEVKFSFCFTSKYKAIWKENLAIYQKSLKTLFQAPLHLQLVLLHFFLLLPPQLISYIQAEEFFIINLLACDIIKFCSDWSTFRVIFHCMTC